MNHFQPIFVILPAYNEQQTIHAVVSELVDLGLQVVIVDDGSHPPLDAGGLPGGIRLLRHCVNLGQGAALQTGMEYALEQGAEFLVTFDADGQHPASAIEKMMAVQQASGADVVLGSRFLEGRDKNVPFRRAVTLRAARWVNFLFTGLLLTDAHNGLRLFTANAASKIRLRENRMAHATEILAQIRSHRLRYTEMAVTIHYTDYSRQKGQRFWSSFRIVFDLLLSKIFR